MTIPKLSDRQRRRIDRLIERGTSPEHAKEVTITKTQRAFRLLGEFLAAVLLLLGAYIITVFLFSL